MQYYIILDAMKDFKERITRWVWRAIPGRVVRAGLS